MQDGGVYENSMLLLTFFSVNLTAKKWSLFILKKKTEGNNQL